MSATELLGLSAREAAEAVAAGSLSAHELFEAYHERALADRAARADGLNCFTWVAERAPDENVPAPLHGVPLAVKDLFCTEAVPSQAGSRILEGYEPPYTASVVSQLTHAGTTLLGKTNQDEFAMGSSNETASGCPAAPRAGAPRRWQRVWHRGRWEPIRAGRSASRPRSAESSG
jgi:aspartyl-tRNA(Asn)/glutamyl-tRNA(Gln) amidotransferase subunit A